MKVYWALLHQITTTGCRTCPVTCPAAVAALPRSVAPAAGATDGGLRKAWLSLWWGYWYQAMGITHWDIDITWLMGILVWLVWVFELKSYEGWVPRSFLSPVEMGIWPRKMRISVAKMLLSDGDMTYSNLYKQPTKLILSTRWNKKHESQWKIQDALGLLPKNWKYTSNLYISILKDWNLGFNPLHGPNPGHMRLLVSNCF